MDLTRAISTITYFLMMKQRLYAMFSLIDAYTGEKYGRPRCIGKLASSWLKCPVVYSVAPALINDGSGGKIGMFHDKLASSLGSIFSGIGSLERYTDRIYLILQAM